MATIKSSSKRNIDIVDKAKPASGFERPPYKAVIYEPYGYCGVENNQGFNCLTFDTGNGSALIDYETVCKIAAKWNKESKV